MRVVLTTFALVVPVELPDKTFVATLVLAARYRPLPVWVGVGAAFSVQTLVAVTAGHLATALPRWVLLVVTLVIFALGAAVLLRTAAGADQRERVQEQEYAGKAGDARTGWRAAGASFVVLLAAEWGDLSQLLTIGQVTRTADPVAVFVGAWAALLTVSGAAVLVGRLLRHLRLSLLHYVGAGVCVVLAAVTAVELARLAA